MSGTESQKTPADRGGRKRGAIVGVAAAAVALATAVVGYNSQYHPMPAPPAATVPAVPGQAPGAPGTGAAAGPAIGTVIMVIRHGEKPDEDVSPLPGISVDGAEDDSSLTKVGWDRANALANVFDPAQGPVRPGLAKPGAIFAAGAKEDGEGKRTRETIGPLAHKLGIQMNIDYGKGDEESLVAAATSQPGPTLICWQHGEIPAIAAAFGSVSPTPPDEWPDDRFDVVWTFTKTASGWRFAQVPEMALPSDKTTTIGDTGLFSGRS
jgi:hypothetical protein